MSDSPQPPDDTTDVTGASADPEVAPEPVTVPLNATPPDVANVPTPVRGWRRRPRLALALAAAGLVAVGGLGGFALGHATAGDGGRDRFEKTSFHVDDRGGFGHHGDHGQPPPGWQRGTAPQGDGSST